MSVFAADVHGDLFVDVLSASYEDNTISLYENNGGSPPVFLKRVIDTNALGAESVFAADVDGDGNMDVLSASFLDDTIAWYENDRSSLTLFTKHIITTDASFVTAVFAADVDGDGDMDVLSASFNDNTIAWYENDGNSPPDFTKRAVDTNAVEALSVFALDLDGDGDVDVISASKVIAWYENDGSSPPVFTKRVIGDEIGRSVFAADVDGDGDVDVVSAIDSLVGNAIAWYENDGSSPPGFTVHLIDFYDDHARSAFAADVDGDGNVDVLSAAADTIAWYKNFPASTSPTASPTVLPTASPTVSMPPTMSPTMSPTASPMAPSTPSPTASPTVTPTSQSSLVHLQAFASSLACSLLLVLLL